MRNRILTERFLLFLKRQLLVCVIITAFAVANPDFARSQERQDNGGFYFMLEGRFQFSAGDKTPFAETDHPFWIPSIVPQLLFSIDTEDGGGGRAGLGYRFGSFDVGIMYSGITMSDKTGLLTGGLSATLGYPFYYVYPLLGPSNPTSYYTVQATAELTYQVMDFEAGFSLRLGQTDVRLFAGVRYADFDQKVRSALTYYSFTTSALLVERRKVEFQGIGPRIGVSVQRNIKNAIGITGSVSGSALFGEKKTTTTQTNPPGFLQNVGSTRTFSGRDRTVWNAEGEMGLTYSADLGNAMAIMFTLGYRAEAWLGVNNTRSGRRATPLTLNVFVGSTDADQIFHGPFLRGEFRF